MKFILTCRKIQGGDSWEESYDKPELKTKEAVEKWGLYIVNWFNSTRRDPNLEDARTLVRVDILSAESTEHLWRKAGAVSTITKRYGVYDTYQCENCHITGKRFGLNSSVKIDSKFRAKKYKKCVKQPK